MIKGAVIGIALLLSACSVAVAYPTDFVGKAPAEFVLGRNYLRGDGVPKDITRGVGYIKDAADQGFFPARLVYAHMLLNGEYGVKKDLSAGMDELMMAANRRYMAAEVEMALAYGGVYIKPPDYVMAAAWAAVAANAGCNSAKHQLLPMFMSRLTMLQKMKALALAWEWEKRHPVGPLFFKDEASAAACSYAPARPA